MSDSAVAATFPDAHRLIHQTRWSPLFRSLGMCLGVPYRSRGDHTRTPSMTVIVATASLRSIFAGRPSKPQPLLNLDVIFRIIEWVYDLSSKVDYDTLRACCLVCTTWRPIAQRMLFRRLEEIKTSRILCFLRSLQRNPRLRPYVRTLTLDIQKSEDTRGCPLSPSLASDILAHCPNVTKILILSDDHDMSIPYPEISRIQALDLNVVALHYRDGPPLNLLVQLLSIWPSVRSLSLDNLWWRPIPPSWRPSPLAAFACISSCTFSALPGPVILSHFTALQEIFLQSLPRDPFTLPTSIWHIGFYRCAIAIIRHRYLVHLLSAAESLPLLRLVSTTRESLHPEDIEYLAAACRTHGWDFDSDSHYASMDVDWIS
ncbi:hypothetical protein FA95DRAFT_1026508 [Auriscalpium vulgare]|uniref:Uncharacterized protein n=1 Tax=Auriscalpium vulgare TaxID=40419 RepID=A0ACB8RXT7_9AGAM|nr:hypothetical protein FA95DRAFT_1026508 [Auriscalpium vulgare]